MFKKLLVFLVLVHAGLVWAEDLPGVKRWDVNQDFNRVYRGYAGRWGDNYNRNGLEEIRSMLFCNIGYTNQLSNQDPGVLSLCPLHITFYQKGPATSILFNRPTIVGQGSPAMPLLKEIEAEVDKAVESGITAATTREPVPGRVMP